MSTKIMDSWRCVRALAALAPFALSVGSVSLAQEDARASDKGLDDSAALEERMAWWEEARFALFIHWGAYSVLGGEYQGETLEGKYAEQIQRICRIPHEAYLKDAASRFRPEDFDAEAWVKLARNAGMKYVVITAKHHDGYGIYHSRHSKFDVEDATGWERDPLKELSEACRRHGLRFGVYYSQSQDWHDVFDPSGDWSAPGNPATNRGTTWSDPAKTANADANRRLFERYIAEKGVPQVVELIEEYGAELLWFDTPGGYLAEYAKPFVEAAREANPDVIINDRIGFGLGDYRGGSDSPVIFPFKDDRYWEAIQSTLHSWGYNRFDEGSRRPTDYLLRMLATVVSRGGNMMINVGPKPDGNLVENDVKALREIAAWSREHIESIHGAGKSPLPQQNWGVVTHRGNDLFLHVFDWPEGGKLRVGGLHTGVASAELMAGDVPLKTRRAGKGVLEIEVPPSPPHAVNSVIQLRCAGEPAGDDYRLIEPAGINRLHVTDTPFKSAGLKNPNGTGIRGYMENWTSPEVAVVWKVRVAERGRYDLQFIYDLPHGSPPGDSFAIEIGDQRFVGKVDGKHSGDGKLIEAEQDRMGLKDTQRRTVDPMGQSRRTGKGPTQGMVVKRLGPVTLEPGTYDMTLKSAGAVRGNAEGRQLFFPRAAFLRRVDQVIQSGDDS